MKSPLVLFGSARLFRYALRATQYTFGAIAVVLAVLVMVALFVCVPWKARDIIRASNKQNGRYLKDIELEARHLRMGAKPMEGAL